MNRLNVACKEGNVSQVTQLLKNEYSQDVLTSAMFVAVNHGHVRLLDHLYLAGAYINGRMIQVSFNTDENENEITLLHVTKDKQTCTWLLDMGIKYMPSSSGEDPMIRAFTNGHMEVVHCLYNDQKKKGNSEAINSILAKGYVPEVSA